MAGGMNKRGNHGTMAERVARSRGELPSTVAGTPEPPQVKHCWVTDHHGRLPGLLLSWRNVAGAWEGRVLHPVVEEGVWIVVEEWLPSQMLEAADTRTGRA